LVSTAKPRVGVPAQVKTNLYCFYRNTSGDGSSSIRALPPSLRRMRPAC
jgi:hypothetical protein